MVKELALSSVILAQAIAEPYDGYWMIGDRCEFKNTGELLVISEGRAIGTGFACYYDSVKQKVDGSYLVISRCYEGTSPAKMISYTMRVDDHNMWIYTNETGELHSKLTRCKE